MADREAGNWLAAYQEYVKESESPDTYHLTVGLSILASVLQRKVWINQRLYLLYPNLYVFLVGPPAKTAKSTAIRLGRRLLLQVEGIVMGPDSVTREELIASMVKAPAITIHSTELSSLIDPSGPKMIQFLTDIFDGDIKWRYSTKHQGKNTIVDPVINLVAGTTPTYVAEALPVGAHEHGFSSRSIYVSEDEPRFLNPFPEEAPQWLIEALVSDLNHINLLQGEFTWSPEAHEKYRQYYMDLPNKAPKDFRLEGFHWRKRIHILKIAMLLSVAEKDDLVLELRDIQTAERILDSLEPNMGKTFSAVGKYEHASDYERILKSIRDSGGMSVSQIYDTFYTVGTPEQLAGILNGLCLAGRATRVRENGTTYYLPAEPQHPVHHPEKMN